MKNEYLLLLEYLKINKKQNYNLRNKINVSSVSIETKEKNIETEDTKSKEISNLLDGKY